ncbi:MAG: glycosyltransferase [Proteobacteria bacterium]|nr:glycosyltransferase [Pseudomonadota bacterium]
MKILMVHNYYQQRGGEDVSVESEISLLREAGHSVTFFSLHNDSVKEMNPVRVAFRTIWSIETYRKIKLILSTGDYDLVHVQNTFPLISPSVYYAANKCGVSVVQSVHNFRYFCVNGFFHDGSTVCERCFQKRLAWPGILKRCYRNSLPGSLTVALLQFIHKQILRTWHRHVDGFIAMSGFVRDKLIEGGFNEGEIFVKPNFVCLPDTPSAPVSETDYFIYVGRLSPEKGIQTLLEAFEGRDDSQRELWIVGDGSYRSSLEKLAGPKVRFFGQQPAEEVLRLIAGAQALIFPSEWYETFGRVAIEAYAVGTPVIASDIGAISELIQSGKTGFLFEAGNVESLRASMHKMLEAGRDSFSANCIELFNAKYSAELNINYLTIIYEQAIASRKNSCTTYSGRSTSYSRKQSASHDVDGVTSYVNMDHIDVDVIILSLNRSKETIEAIASALRQKGVRKHIWVLDQGSEDRHRRRVEEYVTGENDVTLRCIPENMGVSGGRNLVSTFGKAPIIVSLDNDAEFVGDDCLLRTVGYFTENPVLAAISFRILNHFTGKDDPKTWGHYPKKMEVHFDDEFYTWHFMGGGHALRRDLFQLVRGYDELIFFFGEELDLSLKFINLGYAIKYVPNIAITHKVTTENRVQWDSRRYYYNVRNRLYIRAKHRLNPFDLPMVAAGFIIRGILNRVTPQALKGVVDFVQMIFKHSLHGSDKPFCLPTKERQAYLDAYHPPMGLFASIEREIFGALE